MTAIERFGAAYLTLGFSYRVSALHEFDGREYVGKHRKTS